jgi:transposase
LDVVLHLLDCFEYIGGIPEEIVIDQDSTLVVSENHGDILLTKGFTQFKEEMGFRLYVCRKADPESKGKVENLVKFVKTSFFSARRFRTLESVRKSLQSWLVRTANGKISQATGRIPEICLDGNRRH